MEKEIEYNQSDTCAIQEQKKLDMTTAWTTVDQWQLIVDMMTSDERQALFQQLRASLDQHKEHVHEQNAVSRGFLLIPLSDPLRYLVSQEKEKENENEVEEYQLPLPKVDANTLEKAKKFASVH